MNNDSDFPNGSTEERERFISISESARHFMTFKILSNKSDMIIHRSNVRPINIPLDKNIHLHPLTIPRAVTCKRDLSNKDIESTALDTTENNTSFDCSTNIPILDTLNPEGRTFLIPTDENGQRL